MSPAFQPDRHCIIVICFQLQLELHITIPLRAVRRSRLTFHDSIFARSDRVAMSTNHEQDGDISLTTSHFAPGRSHLSNRTSTLTSASARHAPVALEPLIANDVAERIRRWVYDIIICNFDLETGPVIERSILRPTRSKRERENLYVEVCSIAHRRAFSSFPDTSLFAEGSIKFSFRIRNSIGLHDDNKQNSAEEYREWTSAGGQWLYGYVWFEQRRDTTISRGYMQVSERPFALIQKSLVILSHVPNPDLFLRVLDRAAPSFFRHGYASLEATCHDIARWPDIRSGVLDLPLSCAVLRSDPYIRHKVCRQDLLTDAGLDGSTPDPSTPLDTMGVCDTRRANSCHRQRSENLQRHHMVVARYRSTCKSATSRLRPDQPCRRL